MESRRPMKIWNFAETMVLLLNILSITSFLALLFLKHRPLLIRKNLDMGISCLMQLMQVLEIHLCILSLFSSFNWYRSEIWWKGKQVKSWALLALLSEQHTEMVFRRITDPLSQGSRRTENHETPIWVSTLFFLFVCFTPQSYINPLDLFHITLPWFQCRWTTRANNERAEQAFVASP